MWFLSTEDEEQTVPFKLGLVLPSLSAQLLLVLFQTLIGTPLGLDINFHLGFKVEKPRVKTNLHFTSTVYHINTNFSRLGG